MKKVIFFMAVFCSSLFQVVHSQETSFDTELSALRKNIFNMCSQLQAGKPKESQEQLLNDIDNIINSWQEIKKKYTENIPAEYSKDPEWKNYFDEAEDNFLIMKQKVEQQKCKRAAQFCGHNCALFVKMHNLNGKTTITDKMFIVRQNIRTSFSMAKSDNWSGAINTIEQNKSILKKLIELCPDERAKEFKSDLKILFSIDDELKHIIKTKNIDKLNQQFKSIIENFNKIYFKYL